MKKILIGILFTVFCTTVLWSQTNLNDDNQNKLARQLSDIKSLRTRDSLKLESLQKALQELIALQKKEYQNQYKKSTDSVRIQNQLSEIEKIKSNTQGAAVVLDNDTLFTIYANLAAYSNVDRANTAQHRIKLLFEDPKFTPDSLKIGEMFDVKTINYKSNVIVAVDEIDALWVGQTIDSLAHAYKNIITKGVLQAKKNHSFKTKLRQIGEVFLILVVVFTVLFGVNKLFTRLKKYFVHDSKLFPNGINFRNYQLVPKRILNIFIQRFLILVKYFIYLLVLISSITIALKIFPSTEIWAKKAQNIILTPLQTFYNSIIAYLPDLVIVIIIIVFVNWILSIVKYFAKEIEQGNLKFNNFYPEWAKPTYQIFRLLVVVLTLIIIFPYLPGFDTIAFQGISVFLGILISIGSSSAIANAVAGIVITYMRPFKQNDWIKTGDVIGLVIEKNTLVTRLKTINNEDVSVPNSAILSGATINYSSIGRTDGLVITTEIEIDFEVEFHVVEKLLLYAANKTNGITNRLAPYIFYKKINDTTTTYEINAITFKPENMYFIKSDLIKNIQKVFIDEKIPLRSVSIIQIEPNEKNMH